MITAEVLVFRGVQSLFTYSVVDELKVEIGHVVDIPLGNSLTQGLVVRLSQQDSTSAKPIHALNSHPQIPADLCELILWFSDYYLVSPYKAYQTIIGTQHKHRPVAEIPQTLTPHPYALSHEQKQVIAAITAQTGFQENLIYGVTASGKTEVYIQLCYAVIQQQKQAIVLVPEIGLTPQFSDRFKARFGERVVILHSELTPAKRDKAWNQILTGECDVVIGPRSAIFSPVPHLGLVILDEEHDPSYKQENQPRYLTHDIAVFRAKQHQCSVVYGSATPSVNTFYKAKTGHIHFFEMKQRIASKPLPHVDIIDMKTSSSDDMISILSPTLCEAIQNNLDKKEKTILFLNRRGYAPYIVCLSCKKIHSCPSCNLSYTYHHDQKCRCHRCNTTLSFSPLCTSCKKPKLSFGGLGTQKLEAEIIKRFPAAALLRLDRDEAKTGKKIQAIIDTFKASGDILIGTQLIAKGHDIPEVTLVGVLGIDSILHLPDFGSPERAFQLLTQVSGRAGRGSNPGRVIVQSLNANHYALQHAQHHNSEGFFDEDLAFRNELFYPPFSQLVHLIFSGKEEASIKKIAVAYAKDLLMHLKNQQLSPMIIGPKPAPIEKMMDRFRWHILIKIDPNDIEALKYCLNQQPRIFKEGVQLLFDFNVRSVL
jgi:primosomal protein N' (replication factor Y)